MQNAPGVTYIMKEMVKHLFHLVLINALSLFVVRKRTKSGAEYNIKLIGLPIYYYKSGAAVIGMLFDVTAILIVFAFEIDIDIMVVIAALFICIGTGRQNLCLGTGCCNNEPERLLVVLGIDSSIACKE